MAKEIDKIIQSKTAPKSNNVLWDDGKDLKINRNGKWESTSKQRGNIIPYPDLSTQPGILPYRFMGNYVIEQLIPITSQSVVWDYSLGKTQILVRTKLIYSMPLILDVTLVENSVCRYVEVGYDDDFSSDSSVLFIETRDYGWETSVKEGKPLFLRIVYTTLEQDSSYEY